MKKLDLIGKRFNRLTVISEAPIIKQKSYWNCLCDCGKEAIVWGSALTTGQTQSCGCLQKERTSAAKFKHGIPNTTPEYRAWVNMKTRCYNEKVADPDYFGRGITVCERWVDSFVNFINDLGKRPSSLHSIERLDSRKPYSPDNCKWGTEEQQVRNKRNNVWIECNGLRMILSDWARYFGVDQGNLAASIKSKGIDVVYKFYIDKHGSLPSKTQYIPPCRSGKRRKFIPFEEMNALSGQLMTALNNTP